MSREGLCLERGSIQVERERGHAGRERGGVQVEREGCTGREGGGVQDEREGVVKDERRCGEGGMVRREGW